MGRIPHHCAKPEALCQEWAASKGISLTDADQEVEALLVEARHSHEASMEKA
jgi:hypothetical protein